MVWYAATVFVDQILVDSFIHPASGLGWVTLGYVLEAPTSYVSPLSSGSHRSHSPAAEKERLTKLFQLPTSAYTIMCGNPFPLNRAGVSILISGSRPITGLDIRSRPSVYYLTLPSTSTLGYLVVLDTSRCTIGRYIESITSFCLCQHIFVFHISKSQPPRNYKYIYRTNITDQNIQMAPSLASALLPQPRGLDPTCHIEVHTCDLSDPHSGKGDLRTEGIHQCYPVDVK